MSLAQLTLPPRFAQPLKLPAWWLGTLLAGAIAAAGLFVADMQWARELGLSALTFAVLFGIIAGNTFFPKIAASTGVGVDFSKNKLLRAGIVLYGLRITFQQIGEVGVSGALIAALVLGLTFLLAVQLGTRVFKLDRETSMLIGAGSSICGAAAVMATEPVLRASAHKVSVAVATVVVFGTLAMFAYPFVYPHLGLSEHAYGVFAGSTIHEVAQVVAAGKSVGAAAETSAVIEKMLRVMMLAPFLLILSASLRSRGSDPAAPGDAAAARSRSSITIPWFALLFVAVSALNSLDWLPASLVQTLIRLDTVLLAMAMAALGLRTHVGAVAQAGVRPLLLAATLFVFLTVGGYWLNVGVLQWLG